jgi:hypothetical protein
MGTSFKLKNKTGTVFIAHEVPGRRIPTTSLGSAHQEYLEGLPSYRLQDGTALNKLPDGTFQNARTSEVLTIV